MTTDKIIAAAREAGFRTGSITLSGSEIAPIPFIAPLSATDCQHEVGRLYAIAYRAGMERAAEICDTQIASGQLVDLEIHRASFIADTIRAEASRKATAHKEGA